MFRVVLQTLIYLSVLTSTYSLYMLKASNHHSIDDDPNPNINVQIPKLHNFHSPKIQHQQQLSTRNVDENESFDDIEPLSYNDERHQQQEQLEQHEQQRQYQQQQQQQQHHQQQYPLPLGYHHQLQLPFEYRGRLKSLNEQNPLYQTTHFKHQLAHQTNDAAIRNNNPFIQLPLAMHDHRTDHNLHSTAVKQSKTLTDLFRLGHSNQMINDNKNSRDTVIDKTLDIRLNEPYPLSTDNLIPHQNQSSSDSEMDPKRTKTTTVLKSNNLFSPDSGSNDDNSRTVELRGTHGLKKSLKSSNHVKEKGKMDKRNDGYYHDDDYEDDDDDIMPFTPYQHNNIANQLMLRSSRGQRQYDIPQIDCPPAEDDMERFACPSPDSHGRYRCIDDHVLCDGFIDCPKGEDEDRQACMFYKTTKAHLDVLADALLRWARGR